MRGDGGGKAKRERGEGIEGGQGRRGERERVKGKG